MSPQTLAPELQETPVVNAENPWPGLAPFDEAQAQYFYGREREVEDLFRRVRLNLLSVLYGQSGLGKTSLVRAALFPKLRGNGMLPVPIRLDYTDESLPARSQIWQAFAAAMQQAGKPSPALAEDQTLWEYFHHRSLELSLVPVLVFDQFEELFTLGPERSGGAGFVRDCLGELAALIENRPPDRVEARFNREPKLVAQYDFARRDYRMLVSLREDYLAHLHDLSGKIPSITLNNMRLTPLDGSRALEAVQRPGGKLVAAGAAEAIVRVVAGAREERAGGRVGALGITDEHERRVEATALDELTVDPSLLSLLCRELNQKRRDERQAAITPELVEKNRENILNNFYERCLAGLPDGVQVFVEEDLLTETGFRETLNVDNAESKLRQHGADPRALTGLVNRRLLHYDQRGASTRVELTHDVLAPVVRQSRTLRREREAVHEAEARKRRELEESERAAQAARAEAETKLQRSRRQRRVSAAIGMVMAAVAAVAVLKTVQANQATTRANTASDTIKAQNATLKNQKDSLNRTNQLMVQQQAKLQKSTRDEQVARQAAETALASAKRARAVSDTMLGIFCVYSLNLVNTLYDSTASNEDMLDASSNLLDKTGNAIGKMIVLNQRDTCSHRLDSQEKTVAAQVQFNKDNRNPTLVGARKVDGARVKAYLALQALRVLGDGYRDTVSKRIAAANGMSLTYLLYQISQVDGSVRDSVISAAALGIQLAGRIEAAQDSDAINRLARLRHYAAISLLVLGHYDSTRATLSQAFRDIAHAKERPDQDRNELEFTESQVWMRRGEVDSAQHRVEPALAAFDSAVVVARKRHLRMHQVGSQKWLAIAWQARADMALNLARPADAIRPYDSSAVYWGLRAARMLTLDRPQPAEHVDALKSIVSIRTNQARASLRIGRFLDALRYAQLGIDSAAALVAYQNTPSNRTYLDDRYDSALSIFELESTHTQADSAYALWFQRDSIRAANQMARVPVGIPPAVRTLDLSIGQIINQFSRRWSRDTVRKDLPTKMRLVGEIQVPIGRYREREVWLHREIYRRTASSEARDSLAIAVGNLGWSYLVSGRAKESAALSQEGFELAPDQRYMIPNWFNAILLSAPDTEAQIFFTRFAGQDVEKNNGKDIRFECAVRRDLTVLLEIGTATQAQFEAAKRLIDASAPNLSCARP